MTTKKSEVPQDQQRAQYSKEYRAEALALADRIGESSAARVLGLHTSQFYAWRNKARLDETRDEAEQRIATENARLKRQRPEQAEELAM